MAFHLGKAILVMAVVGVVLGVGLAMRPAGKGRADLVVWVFADVHQKAYSELGDEFRRRTGKSVGVEMVGTRSEDVRLVSMFMSDARDVPDAVELEIGSVGKFLRPPTADVGLLPLNGFLERSGWMGKVLPARLAPWSKNGVIFGVPHDVHPITLTYREDLFREAGIDLPAQRTWLEFRAACLRFQDFWRARGVTNRHAIELADTSADHLVPMLLQRHLNPIDGDGRIEMTKDAFAETVAFYVECVAGPTRIASQAPAAAGGLSRDLVEGNLCAFVTPDWRVDYIKEYAPSLAGKMRMMPLPVFEAGDARTATWGGTMMGIPRNARDPEMSWRLIEFLYFSREGIAARRKYSSILPPVTTLWDDPVYRRPDPYFGGQQVDLLFIEMAKELPARYVTPATPMAYGYLSKVLVDAQGFVRAHQGDHAALVEMVRAELAKAAADLRRRIAHGGFDE